MVDVETEARPAASVTHRIAAAALAAGLAWLGLGSAAPAQDRQPTRAADAIRILFVAHVDNVYDPGEALRDGIRVGDVMRGTITYDAAAPDRDARPDVGRYEYHQAPFGFTIEAGPFIFQTDPRHVDFAIVVGNDHGTPRRDSYSATSVNNLPLQNGATISRISWELVDDGLQALDGTTLPLAAPNLERWQSEFGLTVNGQATVEFIIRATVTEARLCTPGMRCPSPE